MPGSHKYARENFITFVLVEPKIRTPGRPVPCEAYELMR